MKGAGNGAADEAKTGYGYSHPDIMAAPNRDGRVSTRRAGSWQHTAAGDLMAVQSYPWSDLRPPEGSALLGDQRGGSVAHQLISARSP